ncbi:MAG: queuosine precursor transporter [Planctomycetes bacterium]|nr:queuosine precursor transporter [Planctomycetota bacterium]
MARTDSPESRPVDFGFLLLASVFLASLVVCNLIANKFLTVDLGFKVFVLSAGALPYPITFLATDLMSEIYGHRRASFVVWSGFAASLFVLLALWLGDLFAATDLVPGGIDDETYRHVFGTAPRVIAASMTAYLVAQLVDVRLFHFWRKLTDGRHLWLRNNASTIVSQLLDSALVIFVLKVGLMPTGDMAAIVLDLWLFKALVALADTPFFYLGTAWLQRWRPRPL